MWVLDYLDDIDSDMSAFHRVDDARSSMPAPLYFARAELLAAYPGVLQVRSRNLANERAKSGPPAGAIEVADDVLLAQLAADGWAEHHSGGDSA